MDSTRRPPAVPAPAAEEYRRQAPLLLDRVDRTLERHPDLAHLIGDNPLRVMRDNHRNHHRFMISVFATGNLELLERTLPWVYRAYSAHGFAFDYFPEVLEAWIAAVEQRLPAEHAGPVVAVYRWMLARHDALVRTCGEAPPPEPLAPAAARMLAALLEGDTRRVLALAEELVPGVEALEPFYLDVIAPALRAVGARWEAGEISVAQEHLATALVTRALAVLYPRYLAGGGDRGRALVTAAPNELHQIGGRMFADLLEVRGWDADFLGANTPASELLLQLEGGSYDLCAISVTMPFNLDEVRELTRTIRGQQAGRTRVLVGGQVFSGLPGLADSFEAADGCYENLRQGLAAIEAL